MRRLHLRRPKLMKNVPSILLKVRSKVVLLLNLPLMQIRSKGTFKAGLTNLVYKQLFLEMQVAAPRQYPTGNHILSLAYGFPPPLELACDRKPDNRSFPPRTQPVSSLITCFSTIKSPQCKNDHKICKSINIVCQLIKTKDRSYLFWIWRSIHVRSEIP